MKTIDKVLQIGILVLVFLLPLFFLPITTDFFDFAKNILLYTFTSLLLICWGIKIFVQKSLTLKKTPFNLPVLALSAVYIISTLATSTNKLQTLWMPQGTGTIISFTVLYFIIINNLSSSQIKNVFNSLLVSASLLTLISFLEFFGLGETLSKTHPSISFLQSKSFTPIGGPLALANFLLVVFVLEVIQFIAVLKKQAGLTASNFLKIAYHPISIILMALGLSLSIYELMTTAKPILLPQSAGWVIALEAFKRFPLLGVGIENFVTAFSFGKPVSLNLTQFWSLRFGVSSNFYLHILTTMGLLGFVAWAWVILKPLKNFRLFRGEETRTGSFVAFLLCALTLLVLPGNFTILFLVFLFLSTLGIFTEISQSQENSQALINITLVVFVIVALAGLLGTGKVLAADYYFRSSLNAAAQNKGTDTYNLQIKAIGLNPYNDTYQVSYSQTNLALANALASKKDLSDQDRQNISTLVQQSIAEAKAAIALSPNNPADWENLAAIYRQLINFAQGADQWTIAAYTQAITLDPTNPTLRLDLGGVYYSLKNYSQAGNQFLIATQLKPDYANAHYNLAAALRENGQLAQAVSELQTTLTLVQPNSNDFKNASKELDDLKAKLPPEQQQTTAGNTPETLQNPETATPGAKITPPLNLPKQAEPPATPVPTSTPTPTATPITSPSATPLPSLAP